MMNNPILALSQLRQERKMMNNPIAANIAITEALGLDPTKIRANGLIIRLDRELGPIIEVDMFLTDADGNKFVVNDEVATELKRYKLVPLKRYKLVPLDDEDECDD